MAVKYHYTKFPPKIKLDNSMLQLVSEARTELGRYDGFLSSMPNSQILLSPLFTQEAVLSSRIEGTQSTLTEVMEFEALKGKGLKGLKGLSADKRNELAEILNYRKALELGTRQLAKLPLAQRLVKQIHKKLMAGVRGKNKSPGEFRKIPVWVGGNNLETARFIPIDAPHINKAIQNFDKYLHNNNDYDDLIKIALLHAEFEAIHPFLDGNGRVGRLLIPLYLTDKKILGSPSFYISRYFEKNRDSYYDLLLAVSKKNHWKEWCRFFLEGIREQATANLSRAKEIVDFYNDLKAKIPEISKSPYGITALDFIFKNSYFFSPEFYKKSKIPVSTAQRLLNKFVKEDILMSMQGEGRRPNLYVFKKLIDIADGR